MSLSLCLLRKLLVKQHYFSLDINREDGKVPARTTRCCIPSHNVKHNVSGGWESYRMDRIKESKQSFVHDNSNPTIKIQSSGEQYCGFGCSLRELREEDNRICLYNIGEFNVGRSSE